MLLPILLAVVWIGHACLWCRLLNTLYGCPISKKFLKPWRLFTGVVIVLGVPLLAWSLDQIANERTSATRHEVFVFLYFLLCLLVGGVVFPLVTAWRFFQATPRCVVHESSRTVDLWAKHGAALLGNGVWRSVARLPLNDPFTVEFREITLALDALPPVWDGLTILYLSDFHFCGTPSRLYFEEILTEIESQPLPDVVALGGDYVDSLEHHAWLAMLSRLKWKEAGLAILGNHDVRYQPQRVRGTLAAMGYEVLSNCSKRIAIRGVDCEVSGNEEPWVRNGVSGGTAPHPQPLSPEGRGEFRLCLSHTPDNFYRAVKEKIDLVLCGHVHGGQIRLPIIGSIFCPSVYGRRFDQGVFEKEGTVMVVGRGISGKEPLRFRCPPQVLRLKLIAHRL